jgi:hypothetical protein
LSVPFDIHVNIISIFCIKLNEMMRAGGWRSVALLLLILLGNLVLHVVLVEVVWGQTFIDSDITKDTVFTAEGSPYIIARSIAIRNGVTLEVRPGAEVRIVDDAVLTVDGRLLALGESGEAIILKGQGEKRNWQINVRGELHLKHVHVPEDLRLRLSDNVHVQVENSQVNGNVSLRATLTQVRDRISNSRVNFNSVKGNVDASMVGIWGSNVNFTSINGAITVRGFFSGSRVSFTSINGAITVADIAYSNVNFTSINGAITVWGISGSRVSFTSINGAITIPGLIWLGNVSFTSTLRGLYIKEVGSGASVLLRDCSVAYGSGISIGSAGGKVIITDCNIYSNKPYGLKVDSGFVLAERNYWGDPSGPYHEAVNPQGKGNAVVAPADVVDFIPWLVRPSETANRAPTPVLEVTPRNPFVGSEVKFDARSSTDDGRVVEYFFDFGDNSNTGWTTLAVVTHVYEKVGTYTASLLVKDDLGVTSTTKATVQVEVQPRPPASPKFVVSGLSISPAEVHLGESVSISLKVTNVGELPGSYTVELRVDGVVVDSKTVMLAGGESTVVTFKWTGKEPGTYSLEIAGQKSQVTVVRPIIPWTLYVGIAVIVAIGMVAMAYRRMRRKSSAAYRRGRRQYASVSGFQRTSSTAAVHPQVLDKLRKSIRQSTPLFERVPHLADVYISNLYRLANARIVNKGPLTPEEMLSILIEAFPSDAELSNRMIDVPDLRRVREDFIHRLAQYFNLSVQDLAEMLADEFNRAHSR